MITNADIWKLLEEQRKYFNTGQTREIAFRKEKLETLYKAVRDNQEKIINALQKDLSKSAYEGYLTEVGFILDEIRFTKKHLTKWAKPKRVRTRFFQFPATSYIYPEPYGVSLIISPWNYPFQLLVAPLIASISAGNCSVIKPSEYAIYTSQIISEVIGKYFQANYIAVIEGDASTSKALLEKSFDHIFFTGSGAVGKIVMQAAAQDLTPVTLELGGKSPCIVDREVNLELSAKRIVSGKFINAGQTCIAPDYLLVHRKVKDLMLNRIQTYIHRFYGENPQLSPDYPRIINEKHFLRLTDLIRDCKVIAGGQTDRENLYMAPTLIEDVSLEDAIMQEEIFGPILPIIPYDNLSEAVSLIKGLPKPLALYFFSNNRKNAQKITNEISFGGGCINDTLMHFANTHLPFGGIGASGIGSYHGKAGFDNFSHQKSIFKKPFLLDVPLRYPPYKNKLGMLKKILH